MRKTLTLLLLQLVATASVADSDERLAMTFQHNLPVVEAGLGDRKVRLILSLGEAGQLGLRRELITDLGLAFQPFVRAGRDVAGADKSAATFLVPEFVLAGRRHRKLRAHQWDPHAAILELYPAIDGVLGREILRQYAIDIDYAGGTLALFDNRRGGGCTGPSIALDERFGDTFVSKASDDSGEFLVLWDTGAMHSFLKQSVAGQRGLETGEGRYRSRSLRFGDIDAGPVDFLVQPLEEPAAIDAWLGYNFFMKHAVCFDARNGRVHFRGD